MCIPTKLQQNIVSLTKDGHAIAQFLFNTMQGETPGVKVCHRMDAAKHLIKFGFNEANSVRPEPVEGPAEEQDRPTVNSELKTENSPVTHLNILNYEIAHLIRHETAEGHTLVEFLIHTMTGRDRPFTPKKFRIKPADRMAAARELLRRGFGELGSRRRLQTAPTKQTPTTPCTPT